MKKLFIIIFIFFSYSAFSGEDYWSVTDSGTSFYGKTGDEACSNAGWGGSSNQPAGYINFCIRDGKTGPVIYHLYCSENKPYYVGPPEVCAGEKEEDRCALVSGKTAAGYARDCGSGYAVQECSVTLAEGSVATVNPELGIYGDWVFTGTKANCPSDGNGSSGGGSEGGGSEGGGSGGNGSGGNGSGSNGSGSNGSGSNGSGGNGSGGNGSGGNGSGGNGSGEGEGGDDYGTGKNACQGDECDFLDPNNDKKDPPKYEDFFSKVNDGISKSPIANAVGSIHAPSGGTCPAPSFSMFGHSYTIDAHCTIFSQYEGLIKTMFMAVWVLLAVLVFLSA